MEFRDAAEVRACFDRVAAVLDEALDIARPRLDGVRIDDRSNRAGFDPSGYGRPEWSYRFERRSDVDPIRSVSVTIRYVEPIVEGAVGELTCVRVADFFHRGAPISIEKSTEQLPLSLDDVAGEGLFRLLASTLHALPQENGHA